MTRSSLKLGCVPYLNAKPLIWTLRDREDQVELHLATPHRLTKLLQEGTVDVALLPSLEYLRQSDYSILTNAAIASLKKVDSVRLFYKNTVEAIETVGLDTHSVTSNTLAKVILEKKYRRQPRYLTYDPYLVNFGERRDLDAVVTIGDTSFKYCDYDYLDLGAEWFQWTQKPFVFALWVTPKGRLEGSEYKRVEALLTEARDEGLKRRQEIARAEAERLKLSEPFCLNYLTHSIHYIFGPEESQGLELFSRYAGELKLCERTKDVLLT